MHKCSAWADPEGGDRGSGPPLKFMQGSRGGGDRGSRPPPWNLKILPKKGNFGIWGGGGLDPLSSVTKNYHFRWTPSHENFWIRAWNCHRKHSCLQHRYHIRVRPNGPCMGVRVGVGLEVKVWIFFFFFFFRMTIYFHFNLGLRT